MVRIGIDIDEVLSETAKGFLTFYNKKKHTNFQFNQITEYSFSKVFNISHEEEKTSLMEFFQSSYFTNLSPVEGSVQAVKKLAKKSELYAVSSRPLQLMPLTTKWIKKYFDNSFKEVILMNGHFDSTETKSSICKQYDIEYFVEDVLDYAKDCASVGVRTFLIDKPWNQETIDNNIITRVTNWQETVNEINKQLPIGV